MKYLRNNMLMPVIINEGITAACVMADGIGNPLLPYVRDPGVFRTLQWIECFSIFHKYFRIRKTGVIPVSSGFCQNLVTITPAGQIADGDR